MDVAKESTKKTSAENGGFKSKWSDDEYCILAKAIVRATLNPQVGANQTFDIYSVHVNGIYETLRQERVQAVHLTRSKTSFDTFFDVDAQYPKRTTALTQYQTALRPAMMKFMGYYLANH